MNNKDNKIAKKVGDGNYGHPTAIVEDKKILRRVGMAVFVFAAVAAL